MKSDQKSKNEIVGLAALLSGELELRKTEENEKNRKQKAIEKQKELQRLKILEKEILPDVDEQLDYSQKKIIQKSIIFEWSSPIRLRPNLDKKAFMTVLALSLLFILWLAIINNFLLMIIIAGILFVIYVSAAYEPINVKHIITTKGIDSIDKMYDWFLLDEFWFTKKNGQDLLIITTKLRAPGKLIMLIDNKDIKPIFMILQDKLLYKDIKKQGKLEILTYGIYLKIEDI